MVSVDPLASIQQVLGGLQWAMETTKPSHKLQEINSTRIVENMPSVNIFSMA